MRERKVSWGTQRFCEGAQSLLGNAKVLSVSAKFIGESKGFVSERKVSWGTLRFCEGAQSFLGNAKVL